MNTLETIGKWIVYGFAAFGAFVILCGAVSIRCRGSGAEQKNPSRQKTVKVEVVLPKLNWRAADTALTKRLDDWNEGLKFRNDVLPVWQPLP